MPLEFRTIGWAAIGTLVVCTHAWSQPADPADVRPYISAGLSVAHLTDGLEESPYLQGLLGGRTVGIQVAGGVEGRRLALEGEVAFTGEVDAAQRDRVSTFNTHHRDMLVTGAVRGLPTKSRRISVEPLAGLTLGFGRERYTDAFELSIFRPPSPTTLPPVWRRYFGFTGGIDLFTGGPRRVQFGMTTRFTMLRNRTHAPDGPRTGLGWILFRVGVAVNVDLR